MAQSLVSPFVDTARIGLHRFPTITEFCTYGVSGLDRLQNENAPVGIGVPLGLTTIPGTGSGGIS
jgi:hypothetical protein